MNKITEAKAHVKHFLTGSGWLGHIDSVSFLASGEYNTNFIVKSAGKFFVFRINCGSQLGLDDQIGYEFRCLKLLENTGVTPRAYFYEPPGVNFKRGALLEEYIAGKPLNYRKDLDAAAYIFSRVHDIHDRGGLIPQEDPVRAIAEESISLLNKYPRSEYMEAYSLLTGIYENLAVNMEGPGSVFSGEDLCVVNTEVNSANFIVGKMGQYLVDWEKAVFSYRYQDLAHFMAKTTTLWKTDYYFSKEDRTAFIRAYSDLIKDKYTLTFKQVMDRTEIMEKAVLLRALSWCYMAYYEYMHLPRPIKNMKTLKKIREYLGGAEWFLK